MTALRHALDALATLAGALLFAASVRLILAGPPLAWPDHAPSAYAARGAP